MENILELGRPQMTTRNIKIAFWVPKDENIFSECEIHIVLHFKNCCTHMPQT